MSTETKTLGAMAAVLCLITIVASIDMALGNPTAINGVVAFGAVGLLTAIGAWGLRRQDKELAAGDRRPRPDYALIARLERELGLVEAPKPGVLRVIEADGETIEIRSWGA
ncbi:hypothetical protein [Streptomyces enissocaesilis]|uniref:Uncharacterized protein n=1 Tax=Streptomyces enissocaesilis TaxID=332589 RepID=A0ABN3WVN3_9ACTN